MFRQSNPLLHFRAAFEMDRVRGMLRGRARLERKLGLKKMLFLLRTQTKYRVERATYWRKTVTRKNIDSAAREHGAGWGTMKNDLARQNVALLPRTQQALAQYEPLAFRAIMELNASAIAPPPAPTGKGVPEEAYSLPSDDPQVATAAGVRFLKEKVQELTRLPSEQVAKKGPKSMDEWVNAWKKFETVDPSKRLSYKKA